MTFEGLEIKIDSSKVYTILKIVILVSVFLVVAMNVLANAANAVGATAAYEEDNNKKFLSGVNNVTDIDWGTAYPAGSYDGNRYPNDNNDLEEKEEDNDDNNN